MTKAGFAEGSIARTVSTAKRERSTQMPRGEAKNACGSWIGTRSPRWRCVSDSSIARERSYSKRAPMKAFTSSARDHVASAWA